jgi:hypothetical protein
VPLGFNFLTSSSGFSFLGFLISLGMMSSKGLNKTYDKKYFENVIPFLKFHKNLNQYLIVLTLVSKLLVW